MLDNLLLSLAALAALLPATLRALRRPPERPDTLYWLLLAVAVAGPSAYALVQLGGPWDTGLSFALWVSIAASLLVFAAIAATTRQGWRLAVLLLPYLLLLGLLAVLTGGAAGSGSVAGVPTGWLIVHIVVSVATYALLTLTAVAGLAAFLQEGALKRKEQTALSRLLPSIADSERLLLQLLVSAEMVLGAGLATGMALQYLESGTLLQLDHKTLLSLLAFVAIAVLLVLHQRTGLRGRRAVRLLLLAYLLLTLAYPGVKFVTDVLAG